MLSKRVKFVRREVAEEEKEIIKPWRRRQTLVPPIVFGTNEMCAYINNHFHLNTQGQTIPITNLHRTIVYIGFFHVFVVAFKAKDENRQIWMFLRSFD